MPDIDLPPAWTAMTLSLKRSAGRMTLGMDSECLGLRVGGLAGSVPTSAPLLQAPGGDGGWLPSAAGEEQDGIQCSRQQMSPLRCPDEQR